MIQFFNFPGAVRGASRFPPADGRRARGQGARQPRLDHRIAGNVFLQGNGKEDYSTLIAVHAEEGHNPSAGLIIEDNEASAAPGFQWTSVFVGDWSGEALVIRNNRLGARITPFQRH